MGAATGTLAVLVVAGWLGVAQLTEDQPASSGNVAGGPDGTSGPTIEATPALMDAIAAGKAVWTQGGLPFRDGDLTAIAAGPDGFVAIGNDWTDSSGQSSRLLRSESGFDWVVEPFPLAGNSGWMSDLTYVDGRFVGFGASFGGGGGSESPVIVTETDGTFQSHSIETEPTIEIGNETINVSASVSSIAVDGDSWTAVGTLQAQDDLFPLIEEALPDDIDAGGGWGVSADGIDVYGPRGDVIHTATAEELDLPEGVFMLMSSGLPTVWRSEDGGETWETERLGTESGGNGWYLGRSVSVGDALLAVVHQEFATALWRIDGDGWSRVEIAEGVAPRDLVRFDDHLYVNGWSSRSSDTMWRSADGVSWEPVGGEATAGVVTERLVVSPFGLVTWGTAAGMQALDPAVVESDDLTLTMDVSGRYVITDAEGVTLLDVFAEALQRGPEGRIAFVDESGEEVLVVTQREIDQAWEQVFNVDPQPVGGFSLLVSEDGTTWVPVDTSSVTDVFQPNTAALGKDAILVSGYSEGGGEAGPAIWVVAPGE